MNDFGIYLVELLKVNTSLKYIFCNDLGDEGMKTHRSLEEIQLDEIGEEG